MRRIPASLGGVAFATALLVTPAAAAPSQRISDTESVLVCDAESDDGTVFTFAVESETFGSFALLEFWQPPSSPGDDPTWISVTGSVDFDGTSVTATYEMVEFNGAAEDPFGDPVGSAMLQATLTPVGDPQPYSDEGGGSGNQKFRRDGVFQEYSVSGTLDLPMDISFALSTCAASSDTFTVFSNSPASSVFRSSDISVSCGWQIGETIVSLFAAAGDFGPESQLFVSEGEEAAFFGVENSPLVLTSSQFTASFDVFDAQDPEPVDPVGSAEAAATLSRSGHFRESFSFDRTKVHITGTTFAVDGSLSIMTPDGTMELAMDDESCFASESRIAEQTRSAPRGKPLPNDAPENALPIAIGEIVSVSTGHTDLDPEEPCTGEGGDFPIGHTAWWTFEGTGGEVTIDTAGSDFDTVVGVYTDDGGELVPLGCADDIDSLQARITIATDAGVTYWIQAGGFGDEFGSLVLTVN